MNALIYDIEIAKCIPPKDGQLDLELAYCKGWEDYAGMGIAVLCAWDCLENTPLVYMADNLFEFDELQKQRQFVAGFNSVKFDNHVLDAAGIEIPRFKSYDLLRELWLNDGLDPDNFNFKTHGGYSLEACCQVNFGTGKSGTGASAPEWWQRGQIAKVVNYCLRDVMLTRRLLMRARDGSLKHPKTGELVKLELPEGLKI